MTSILQAYNPEEVRAGLGGFPLHSLGKLGAAASSAMTGKGCGRAMSPSSLGRKHSQCCLKVEDRTRGKHPPTARHPYQHSLLPSRGLPASLFLKPVA